MILTFDVIFAQCWNKNKKWWKNIHYDDFTRMTKIEWAEHVLEITNKICFVSWEAKKAGIDACL